MKKFFNVVCLMLAVVLLFSACGPTSDTTVDPSLDSTANPNDDTTKNEEDNMPDIDYTKKTLTMKQADGYFRPLGRTFFVNNSIACDWAAAGAEFTAYCKGDVSVKLRCGSNEPAFKVTVDGETVHETLWVQSGSNDYVIAENLSEGLHTIRIVCIGGDGWRKEIDSITLTGELVAYEPDENTPFIEIIGDSITSGHGLASGNGKVFLNAAASYAYLTLEKLNADYSICSRSGMGVAFSKTDDNVFERVYPIQSFRRNPTASYVPTRTPDLIIINLSQNDNDSWYDNGKGTDNGNYTRANFEAAFDNMIRTFENQYGKDVPMLFIFGCMQSPAYTPYATNIMKELISTKYITEGFDIKTVELTTNRYGAGNHPDANGAKKQSNELYAFIEENYPELVK